MMLRDMPPNYPMRRARMDKLPGRGRLCAVPQQVTSAHVLIRRRAVADGSRQVTLKGLAMADAPNRNLGAAILLSTVAGLHIAFAPKAGAAEAADPLLAGCAPTRPPEESYPLAQLRNGINGRVLLVVERSTKGRLKVLEIVQSEPSEAFNGPARSLLKSLRCTANTTPITRRVSITFSTGPGPGLPHFEGSETHIEIRSKLERVW